MLKRFKAPPVTQEELLTILDRSGCSSFATALAKSWGYDAQP
jgi:HD-like signal output (HDOD) protein